MKTFKTAGTRKAIIGLVGLMVLVFSQHAYAAGTASNTNIANNATVNYQVNSIAQDPKTSNTVNFVVDNKVNLNVVTLESATVSVTPGSTGGTGVNVLRYTVTNTGNTVQDFAVSATAFVGGAAPFTGTDNIDATAANVFVDGNANGTYESGTDTATFIDELTADANTTVFIVSNFATSVTNSQVAAYHLLAEARTGGSGGGGVGGPLTEDTGGDNPATVQIVFGDIAGTDSVNDAAEDAKFSDDAQYTVSAATLSVSKSSAVISDPFNGTTNPLAIPDAVVEYTITISNAGSAATATNIAVSDSINAQIANINFNTGTIKVTAPNINGGVEKTLTDASGDDEGDWNVTATNTVTVTGITLLATESATVKFRVTIQ